MKKNLYVFGFDNTLVNTEDIIVRLTAEVLHIPLTCEFWYANLHAVPSVEDEMHILEKTFGVKYTPELQQETGRRFMTELATTPPNAVVLAMLKAHLTESLFLTGSPAEILKAYLATYGIALPPERMHCGIYNASGEKEKVLARLIRDFTVTFIDDDPALVRTAATLGCRVLLVRQPYNVAVQGEFETID